MAQPSSSSFVGSWRYHVFLNFRGEDTRNSFTDHLCRALRRARIYTFMDYQLQRGEELSTALLKTIEESKIPVVVFSENYASSRWCLEELVKILECRKSKKQLVRPIFYKVEPSHIRNQSGSFGDAFASLQCKHKDNMVKWRAALTEAANLLGWTLYGHESESVFIQKIVGEISEQLGDYAHLDVAKYPVGMKSRVQRVNALLDLEKDNVVRMVGIWGTGGIGKTTLAKAVYNSIANKFEGCCFLANVRESSESHEGLVKLQKTLLSEILSGPKLKVANLYEGVTLIKEFLRNSKVLLVLDDVNHWKQLDNLAGGSDWFGAGSRIIITTRDKKVLMAHDVNSIYDVKGLDDHEALELFSWNAFNGNALSADYAKLAYYGIRRAGGLPLVLILLGRHLRGERLDIWRPTLDGLIQGQEHQGTFIISYNQLDTSVKEVFLYIACFFKGLDKNYVTEILEAYDPNAKYGVEVLIEKALISIKRTHILMHDSLEEMGKQIVIKESPVPGKRSRLWCPKDVCLVLTENMGTDAITGIMVKLPVDDYEICLNKKSFSKMKNLKICINCNACVTGDVRNLPSQLRVLDWYKLQSFPTDFRPKELVVLKLPFNRIKQPAWCFKPYVPNLTILKLSDSEYLTQISDLSGCPNLRELRAARCGNLVEVVPSAGYLDKLEVLDFKFCINLTQIPDLGGSPNLKELHAKGCGNLTEVHPSVGNLYKLEELDFSDCTNLKKFPKEVHFKSLKRFSLAQCRQFENFPEIMDVVESISVLDLDGTSIQNFPLSIGKFVGVERLACNGSAIKKFPSTIEQLTRLEELSLAGTAIEELSSSIEQLTGLRLLSLDRTAIKKLPSSIGQLVQLELLSLNDTAIKELPSTIGQLTRLEELSLAGTVIEELLSSFEQLTGLRFLSLDRTAIKEFPSSIGQLVQLELLSLNDTAIKELPSSIGQLTQLQVLWLNDTAIKELPSSIGQLTQLQALWLNDTAIKELPSSIGNLVALEMLSLNRCSKLVTLPDYNNLNNSEFSSLELFPHLEILDFKECNLSNTDYFANFGRSETVDLSRCNLVSLPVCISKFFYLRHLVLHGCRRLQEISIPLPPSIRDIDVSGCISLEIFSTLSKILKGGCMQRIERMNLSNCQRLCETVGMDVSKLATILLDQQLREKHWIKVILPGSEVPEWFSFCKNVHDDYHMVGRRELVFQIPWGLKWESMMSLFVCFVFTDLDPIVKHDNGVFSLLCADITIDGVRNTTGTIFDFIAIDGVNNTASTIYDEIGKTATPSHVFIQRINIPELLAGKKTKKKAEVDDIHNSNQLMPYKSLVLDCNPGPGVIIKSCGVHLQT